MKRLLLLLGCVAAFSSCLKNDKFERDMTSTGYIIYSSAAKQTLVALDPFNVAFRLNILIAEGAGTSRCAGRDPAKMFSTGTAISYDETCANYKLVFNSGSISGDYPERNDHHLDNGYGSLAKRVRAGHLPFTLRHVQRQQSDLHLFGHLWSRTRAIIHGGGIRNCPGTA
ncbi:MAG: hypothetical protein ACLUEV_00395 [Alistipes sp.]